MIFNKVSNLFILLFPILISCEVYNSKHESNKDKKDSKISIIEPDTNKKNIYLPHSEGQIVHHNSYSLAYSEKHEQAIWVYYFLTSEMINGKFSISGILIGDYVLKINYIGYKTKEVGFQITKKLEQP